MINIILACDKNYAIGKDNDLIYHFKEDLTRFKELTNNQTIVMGRKTFESLPKKLPNRKHVVLSRDKNYKVDDDVILIHDIEEKHIKK
jgi:dihydrofolate reductase